MKLRHRDKQKIDDLIEVCKKYSGEYIPGGHGSGSWATTYSNQYINATAELYAIFEKNGCGSPINMLSKYLIDAGVRSCRGGVMNIKKVEYLYQTHLINKIKKLIHQ